MSDTVLLSIHQLPYAVFAFNPTLRRLPGKVGEDGCCLMTSAVFNIPFLRQVYSWVKGFPVDKRTFLGRLHRGESFAFTPVSSYVVFAPVSFIYDISISFFTAQII